MTDNLRTRIAAVLKSAAERRGIYRIADFDYPHLADAVIEALPEMPVKVTTTDELDALPFLTVIREVRALRKGIDYGSIYERRTSGWQCIDWTWVEPERNGGPSLPVMVLWRGKDGMDERRT